MKFSGWLKRLVTNVSMQIRFDRAVISLFVLIVLISPALPRQFEDIQFKNARSLFTLASKDKSKIEQAKAAFTPLADASGPLQGRSITYMGALRALDGKYSIWIPSKISFVLEGCTEMERGLKLSPQDLESLFIYGFICWKIPVYFGRKDDGRRVLEEVMQLLPGSVNNFDAQVMNQLIDFLLTLEEMSASQRIELERLRPRMNNMTLTQSP